MKHLEQFQDKCRKNNELKCHKCKSVISLQDSVITKNKKGKLVMVCRDCSEIMKRN